MHAARIAELLAPFFESGRPPTDEQQLTTNDLDRISTYIDILLRWNARVNLTAIRDPEQIVTRHFGESLFAARHLFPRAAQGGADALVRPATDDGTSRGRAALQGRVEGREEAGALAPEAAEQRSTNVTLADLGSGAGFPGLPIKLWAPHVSLTLIESNHKKVAFLREITRALILTDINILHARAETLSALAFDVVTLRAVERFQSILPIAARLLAPSGRLALLIGASQADSARGILPHLNWDAPIPIPRSRSGILLLATSLRRR